jgi:hypothetical protein
VRQFLRQSHGPPRLPIRPVVAVSIPFFLFSRRETEKTLILQGLDGLFSFPFSGTIWGENENPPPSAGPP